MSLVKNAPKAPYIASDGRALPGVTTVIKALDKGPGLLHWAWKQGKLGFPLYKARDQAIDIGHLTHYLIEKYVKGEKPELSNDFAANDVLKAHRLFDMFRSFWDGGGYKLIASELKLIDERKHGYGGTIDILAECPNGIELLDLKTSKEIWPEYYIQVAAYKKLTQGKVMLPSEPKARIVLITKDEYFDAPDIPEGVITKAGDVWEDLIKVYYNLIDLKKSLG